MRILKWLTLGALPVLAGLGALAPSAMANIEQGHPEAYSNNALVGEKSAAVVQVGFGQIHLESTQLGSEGIECVNLGFGSGWNEGTGVSKRAEGQILAWDASGHVPEGTHSELAASCRPHGEPSKPGSFATDESNAKSESNGTTHEVEPTLRHLSTPWNVEIHCGVREESYQGIVTIGVPNSEFPKAVTAAACPGEGEPSEEVEQAEIASYAAERTGHHGCYASIPAPEGCIRVTIVEPGAGLEVGYGGTEHAKGINGVKNGLTATKWKFEGPTSGELQCEFPSGCVATGKTFGEVKEDGYKEFQLIQGR